MANLEGTTYPCETEKIGTRKEIIDFFRNHRKWITGLAESPTYLVRQMARFVLLELTCGRCDHWEQTDDGCSGQYKVMPAIGRCTKYNRVTQENETC